MPSFNQVNLMGNVTRDPQLKQLPGGNAVAEFGLAINRKYKTGDSQEKEEVCFVDCEVWGKQAETIQQYVTKGKPLFVTGRLKYDTWEDKTGGKRSKLTVNVQNFQFLGSRDDSQHGEEERQPPRTMQQGIRDKRNNRPAPAAPFGDDQFKSDDIPF